METSIDLEGNDHNLPTDVEENDKERRNSFTTEVIALWATIGLLVLGLVGWGAYYVPWVYLIEIFFVETESLGLWGNFLLIFGFVVISFPFTFGYIPLSLGAGYLYGVFIGTITSTVGSTLGSALCFWSVRKLLRPFCLQRMGSVPYAEAFLGTGDNDESTIDFTSAVLWRFAPIPFGFSNALFALSSIHFGSFVASTMAGLLPFQIMWVFLGTTLRSLADVAAGNVEGSSLQMISLVVQLMAAVVVPIYVCYRSMSKKPAPPVEDSQVLTV